MNSGKNGKTTADYARGLDGDDVARLIARLQNVALPAGTRASIAGDLLRINDTVKKTAGDQLDFFDVPANFARVMKGAS